MLVCLRVNIGRYRSSTSAIVRPISEKLQPCLDVRVAWVQFSSPLVSVQSIIDLIVAALIQGAQIVPNLRNEGVQADSPRVGIQSVPVLVDLIVEHTDGTPEGRIATIAIHSLLISFVGFGVLGLRHVASTEKIPALGIAVVCSSYQNLGGACVFAFEDDLPAATDFSRNSIAFSWLAKLLLC